MQDMAVKPRFAKPLNWIAAGCFLLYPLVYFVQGLCYQEPFWDILLTLMLGPFVHMAIASFIRRPLAAGIVLDLGVCLNIVLMIISIFQGYFYPNLPNLIAGFVLAAASILFSVCLYRKKMGNVLLWILVSLFGLCAAWDIIKCIDLFTYIGYVRWADTWFILSLCLYLASMVAHAGYILLCFSFKEGIAEAQRMEAAILAQKTCGFCPSDFRYTLTPNGGACIVQYTGLAADITVPSVLDEHPVVSVGSYAFSGAHGLTSVTFPAAPISLGYNPFYGCTKLTSIRVPDDHPTLAVNGGVLFSKVMKKLIWYPSTRLETAYTVPNGIVSIDNYAFYGCTRLTEVTIPPCVTTIGEGAFARCPGLTLIVTDGTEAHRYVQENGLRFITIYPENKAGMDWLEQ